MTSVATRSLALAVALSALVVPQSVGADDQVLARSVAADAARDAYLELRSVLPRLADYPHDKASWRALGRSLAVLRRVEQQFEAELDECYRLGVLASCSMAFKPNPWPVWCLGNSEVEPGYVEQLARTHNLSAPQLDRAASYRTRMSCSEAPPSEPGDGPFERQFGHRPPLPLTEPVADDAAPLQLRIVEPAPKAFSHSTLEMRVQQAAPARALAWTAQVREGNGPWEDAIPRPGNGRFGVNFTSTETFSVRIPKRVARYVRARVIATDGRQVATLEYGPFQFANVGVTARLETGATHRGLPLFDEDARTILGDSQSLFMKSLYGFSSQAGGDLTCEWYGPRGQLVDRRECRAPYARYPRKMLGRKPVKLHVRLVDQIGNHATLYFYVDASDAPYDALVRQKRTRDPKRNTGP